MENRPGVLVGDRQTRQKRGALLLRLWRYLGRNRLLLAVAVGLSLGSNIWHSLVPGWRARRSTPLRRGQARWTFPLF